MIKKTILFVIAVTLIASGVLLLGSCLPPDAGGKLMVNNDGHFLEDIIYIDRSDGNKITETFFEDGSFRYILEQYDTTDNEWIIISGHRGSYTWDPTENVLERVSTHWWDAANEQWDRFDDEKTQTIPRFFTQHKYYAVYTRDDSNTNLFIYEEATEARDYLSERKIELEIDADRNAYSASEKHEEREEGKLTDYSYDERWDNGSYEIFPEGRAFALGNTATLSYEAEYNRKGYDDTLEDWEDWSDTVEVADSFGYIHMGDFVLLEVENRFGNTIPASFRDLTN